MLLSDVIVHLLLIASEKKPKKRYNYRCSKCGQFMKKKPFSMFRKAICSKCRKT